MKKKKSLPDSLFLLLTILGCFISIRRYLKATPIYEFPFCRTLGRKSGNVDDTKSRDDPIRLPPCQWCTSSTTRAWRTLKRVTKQKSYPLCFSECVCQKNEKIDTIKKKGENCIGYVCRIRSWDTSELIETCCDNISKLEKRGVRILRSSQLQDQIFHLTLVGFSMSGKYFIPQHTNDVQNRRL